MSKSTVYASAECDIQVQFYDLDPMNVVWHGNYARYFEQARCVLLDKIGYNYPEMKESGYLWPIIDMHTRYIQALRFGQIVTVKAELIEYECRLTIRYTIFDKETGKRLCKGTTQQVAVEEKTGELQLVTPAILAQKLGLID